MAESTQHENKIYPYFEKNQVIISVGNDRWIGLPPAAARKMADLINQSADALEAKTKGN